ncbi:MAG: DUF1805 domain-containing protein [Dethiobacter sp.]|nr:DUF1805 domain-containing protein [Dethiobacter sp.]
MLNVQPIQTEKGCVVGIEVTFPKTKLLSLVVPNIGYIMCGVLNTEALDLLHPEREIIAARLTGVRTLPDLLTSEIKEATDKACSIGIKPGMSGEEALNKMIEYGEHQE